MEVSLPGEEDAFSEFLSTYPSYKDTMMVDALRREEYRHLDDENGQVCLDYTGVGLFSSSQRNPDLMGGFGISLSYTSANLATHAMYMEGGSTECFFRRRILRYLNLDQAEFYIVFTANSYSAFKLLGESYPFHEAQNLLLSYDHKCENVEAISECANAKGAHVQSACLSYPWLRVDDEDMRRKLLRGRRNAGGTVAPNSKGLLVYPHASRVTGCKNSSQWILEAQESGWHVLVDLTSVDAKISDSLGLSLFAPDFLICSFYYVFGEDPTGFGCLVIKKSVLRTLGDSARARAIGMVKIVTKLSSLSSSSSSPGSSGRENVRYARQSKGRSGHRRSFSSHGLDFDPDDLSNTLDPNGGTTNGTMLLTAKTDHERNIDGVTTYNDERLDVGPHADTQSSCCSQEQGYVGTADGSLGESVSDVESTDRFLRENINVKESSEGSDDTMSLSKRCSYDENGIVESRNSDGTEASGSIVRAFDWEAYGMSRNGGHGQQACGSMDIHFVCKGLDHADMLGYKGVTMRLRALTDWLFRSLSMLRHPGPNSIKLVRIYSQMSLAYRGSTAAFTLLDAMGNALNINRVQKLADRSNISLRTGMIVGTLSSLQGSERDHDPTELGCIDISQYRWRRLRGDASLQGVVIPVVYASLGFLNDFSDVYRLYLFISQFLDPEFIRRELWLYRALDQRTIEI